MNSVACLQWALRQRGPLLLPYGSSYRVCCSSVLLLLVFLFLFYCRCGPLVVRGFFLFSFVAALFIVWYVYDLMFDLLSKTHLRYT